MTSTPQTTHSLPEGLETLLKHSLPRLQVSSLLRDLRWLSSNESNLLLGHLSDDDRGEDDARKGFYEVAFDAGFADRGDEVLELIL